MYGLGPYGTVAYGAPASDPTPDIEADMMVTIVVTAEMTGFNALADVIERARGRRVYGAIIKPWRLGDR